MLPHLSQQEAKEFDNWLMSPSGGAYTLQQLMELAGLTVALVIAKYYPNNKNIFIATGPGNNGGDGLVAARHLAIFNYSVTIYRPEFEKQDSDFFKVK
jgi:NAD(P)H-hydrate epimerase